VSPHTQIVGVAGARTVAVDYLAGSRLWLLTVVVALAAVYVVLQFRRRATAVRFANAELLASVVPRHPGWRRHLTTAMLLSALALFVVAFARPARREAVAQETSIIMLAIDVSLSMQADDVSPSRIDAAQEAAVSFVEGLPEGVQVGLVKFAGAPTVLVSPTDDKAKLIRAIERLRLDEGTGIGNAIFASLDALDSAEVFDDRPSGDGAADGEAANDGSGVDDQPPARIVVMSDGKTTIPDPPNDAEASGAAAALGVPVSTIAFGTSDGIVEDPASGDVVPVPVDPIALQAIADATGGIAYEADSLETLEEVYADIGQTVTTETQVREIGEWFVGFGLLAAGLAAAGSLWWFGRMV
jgi:Ca-activated chloride channel homolog